MAAKDYDIVESCFGNFYFAKRLKSKRNTMSQDRKLIEDKEIIGMFISYMRNRCEELNDDTVVLTECGKPVVKAKFYDFKKIEEENHE